MLRPGGFLTKLLDRLRSQMRDGLAGSLSLDLQSVPYSDHAICNTTVYEYMKEGVTARPRLRHHVCILVEPAKEPLMNCRPDR